MTIFLGFLKELNNVRFKLSSNEPLDPATVLLVATDSVGFAQDVPMSPVDLQHFEGVWDTQTRALGDAVADAHADDLGGNPAAISGDLTLISSYGRRYGQDYGNGM